MGRPPRQTLLQLQPCLLHGFMLQQSIAWPSSAQVGTARSAGHASRTWLPVVPSFRANTEPPELVL